MHNLFGDTNTVHVSVHKDGYEIEQIIDGETVAEVLDYVQYNPKKLVRNVETWVTRSMKSGKITPEEDASSLATIVRVSTDTLIWRKTDGLPLLHAIGL